MHGNRNGPPMKTAGVRRHRSALCGVVIALLVAPLVGCGAAGTGSEAAGDKAGGDVPAEPVVLQMLNPAGEWNRRTSCAKSRRCPTGSCASTWSTTGTRPPSPWSTMPSTQCAPELPRSVSLPSGPGVTRAPSFDALVAPLLVDRPALQAAVLHSDVAADMLAGLDGSGLTGIGILPGPMQHPVGVTRDLLDVADYQGAAFAIPPGTVLARSVEALGATPTASFFGGAPVAEPSTASNSSCPVSARTSTTGSPDPSP